jgi:hypothetical protein
MSSGRALAALLAVAPFAACALEDAGAAERSLALRDGTSTMDPRWNAVVYLRAAESCTGALVAPNLVLTAAHCVATRNGKRFACDPLGQVMETGTGLGRLQQLTAPERIAVYAAPRADEPLAIAEEVFTPSLSSVGCANDIAFVRLQTPIEDITPLRLELDVAPEALERVEAFGFGQPNARATQAVRNQITAEVQAVGTPEGMTDEERAYPGTLRLDLGLCDGDSGGPVVALASGAVVAVLSNRAGALDCLQGDSVAYATLVPAHRELAALALRRAGAPLPRPEGGAGCAVASDPARRAVPLLFWGVVAIATARAVTRKTRWSRGVAADS